MPLEFSVTRSALSNDFWEKFSLLWQNSLDRSPFKSPHILRYFAEMTKDKITVFQCFNKKQLLGVVFLKENAGTYTFLSDLKTDVNFFVLDHQLSPEEQKQFFEGFLQTVKREKWKLILNNQPAWANYMSLFEEAGKSSGLYWLNYNYSVCPIAEADSPEELHARIGASHKFRYYANRLIKQQNAVFEVLTDDSDMDTWVEDFCQTHIRRWADTSTPSQYVSSERRQFLAACLRAWQLDAVLVRFSIRTPEGRIGFAIGLLEEKSVVFHATTYHPDYGKYSPGKALIYFITGWMVPHGLRILDFGDGDEPYKYEAANREHVLTRIFISGKLNLLFIARTQFIKAVRGNKKAYDLYQNKLKPAYRNLYNKMAAMLSFTFCLDWVHTILLNE